MRRVGGFVPQKIAVGAGFAQAFVAFPAAFSKRKRYGAVGMLALDCAQESAEAPIGKIRVLAALQDKCAEAQRITLPAAGQDAVRVKTVALTASVASAEPAVQAVVFADAADFDQTADVNFVSVDSFAGFRRKGCQPFRRFGGPAVNERFVFAVLEPVRGGQTVDQGRD